MPGAPPPMASRARGWLAAWRSMSDDGSEMACKIRGGGERRPLTCCGARGTNAHDGARAHSTPRCVHMERAGMEGAARSANGDAAAYIHTQPHARRCAMQLAGRVKQRAASMMLLDDTSTWRHKTKQQDRRVYETCWALAAPPPRTAGCTNYLGSCRALGY